ncbi:MULTISPECIES: MarR family winged helix-turn-helix transcriptional regulator [Pandoraea]|uniref:MarR family transcriptional regulator n=1 Tax=Pandoraea communis TaxID=2508297 RepID=A0A5E4X4K5_9BURK|nr:MULTISPECIES: MarR family winged helix-turn-helix transcriptional regulator [Pandoraea]EON10958.1 MarR family transcriptional regulator [Pandoraea sp. SD6-2]VVE31291.1 MarR family transcriptional regulator [Pandoraea communis]
MPAGGAPFVDDYLAYLLARASTLVSNEFHREVAAAGLGVSEWRVLATLSDGRARTINQLADIVLAKQPTLTKVVDRLEATGDVVRGECATDRRQSLVSLTDTGRARVAPLLASARRHEAGVLARFGTEQSALLKATLRRLIEEMAQGTQNPQ